MRVMTSVNPSTGEVLGEVPMTTSEDIRSKVQAAQNAQSVWQALGLTERVKILRALPLLIEQHKQALSELTSREMGQPISLSEAMTNGSIVHFRWNLDHAAKYLKNEISFEDDTTVNEIIYEPRGVIACIMAWNFAISNFVWSVSQALIAGNAVIVKFSEEIPLFSKMLEEICAQSGLPQGVLAFVHGDGQSGTELVDQDIDMILFTGSTQTGQKLYAKAAEKGIPAVMELGGSSPGVIFSDVDLKSMLKDIFNKRFSNCGQFCSNLKRLIVHRSLFDACVAGLAQLARGAKLADPMSHDTEMGPLVAERQVVKLEGQVKDAVTKGAVIVCGGKRPDRHRGAWYEPTILTHITKDMRVWHEEVFGPVLPVVPFDTYEEAIALANDTAYGLTAYIYTQDKALAAKAAKDIRAGCIGINNQNFFRPETPFGGMKKSGLGRENGKWGFHEVCQIKVVAREK